jgi:hemerythrin
MKWSAEFATGDERIDAQHKMLFKMMEDFQATLDEGLGERIYGEVLQSLDVYARTHFSFEEGVMEQFGCPASLQNKQAHERFVEILAGFQERYAQDGFDRADALELVAVLDRWLASHISRLDVQLKGCMPGT